VIAARLLVSPGPCPNCKGVGSLPATTYSVGGPDRYPCGVCGGLKVRLVEAPGDAPPELVLHLDAQPEACDRCDVRATCAICRRCRTHCRCTPGVDLRGTR